MQQEGRSAHSLDDQEPISPLPVTKAFAPATTTPMSAPQADIKGPSRRGFAEAVRAFVENLWRDPVSIHPREYLSGGDIVVVNCTHQSDVMVMDDLNYGAYRRGSSARYYGGFYKRLPARIAVPHSGHWNIVLNAPGGARYGMSVIRN